MVILMSKVIVNEDFENGLGGFQQWVKTYGGMIVPKAKLVPSPADQIGHSGTVLEIPYDIDEPGPIGTGLRADCNRFIQWQMKQQNLHNFSVAGKFSLANRPGDVLTSQRKLFYLWGAPQSSWNMVLSAWGGVPSKTTGELTPIRLELSTSPYSPLSGGAGKLTHASNLQYNKAYNLELRVNLNSIAPDNVPNRDGTVEVLLDGVSIMKKDGLWFRKTASPLGMSRVGAQINDGSHVPDGRGPRYETRYWDKISISDLSVTNAYGIVTTANNSSANVAITK